MADDSRPRPPRTADALLRRVLPDGPKSLTILGDLHEEFEDVRRERGLLRARRWFWRAALSMTFRYGLGRFTRRPWGPRRGAGELLASLTSDLRIGTRMLWKTRGLSTLAILTMGLGIGAATHAFSLVTGTVLRQPPIEDAERLVVVGNAYRSEYTRRLTQQEYLDLTTLVDLPLEEPAGFYQYSVTLASAVEGRAAERVTGALMSPRAFAVVGVEPLMGRVIDRAGDAADGGRQMVISYEVWRNSFASDPDVIGRTVRADGGSAEVVGVMPDGFGFPFDAQVWLPLDLAPTVEERAARSVDLFGRIPEGVDFQAASDLFDTAARRLSETLPDRYRTLDLRSIQFAKLPFNPQWFTASYAAFIASLGVLFIACVNAANLLLARSSVRYGEVAIRMALGASRARVIRQLLVETTALAAAGTVLGLGLTAVGVPFVARELAARPTPYWVGPGIDGQVLLFAVVTMVATGLLAGVYPAVRATRPNLDEVLRDGTRGSSLRMGRVSRWLVVGEIAVSCGLLIVAGLTIKSLTHLRGLDLGFDPEPVFTAAVAPFATRDGAEPVAGSSAREVGAEERSSPWSGREAFYREVRSRVEALAPAWSAAFSSGIPALNGVGWTITVEGERYERPEDHPVVQLLVVTEGFFETLGVPIELGRDIQAHETWDPDEAAAVVSRSFVRKALRGRPTLGSRVKIGMEDDTPRYARIVGVVPDSHAASALGSLSAESRDPAQLFITPGAFASTPLEAGPAASMWLLVRTAGSHATLLEDMRWAVASVDPDAPVFGERRLPEWIESSLWAFNLIAAVFSVAGLLALFLAAVGLYGVVAFSVGQSTQELGIRIALGADAARIRRMVLGRAGAQMVTGLVLGLVVGYALGRPVASFNSGIDPRDPAVYGVIVLMLLLTGLVATVLPARAAARVDPVQAMRE